MSTPMQSSEGDEIQNNLPSACLPRQEHLNQMEPGQLSALDDTIICLAASVHGRCAVVPSEELSLPALRASFLRSATCWRSAKRCFCSGVDGSRGLIFMAFWLIGSRATKVNSATKLGSCSLPSCAPTYHTSATSYNPVTTALQGLSCRAV